MADSSDNADSGFMESLGGIRKLKQDRVDLLQQRPRKTNLIKKSVKNQTVFTSSAVSLNHVASQPDESWFHHGIQNKLKRKIKMGQLAIDATLDLHGYRQIDAIAELVQFLQHALKAQARFLLIIHGKGFRSQSQAVLRPLVQRWLQEQSMVLAYCPAQARDGGSGASYVYLKRS